MRRKGFHFLRERRWLYPILAGVSCLFLFFGLPHLLGPSLSRSQQEWRDFSQDDPKAYPLEVVSHGYRMVRAYRKEARQPPDTQSRTVHLVEWEWKIAVKNKSGREVDIYAHYALVDKERSMVDLDFTILQKPAPSGETVEITRQTEMFYQDLSRVDTGVWEISWEEGKAFHHSRRKGF